MSFWKCKKYNWNKIINSWKVKLKKVSQKVEREDRDWKIEEKILYSRRHNNWVTGEKKIT